MHTLRFPSHATYVHHNGDFSGNVQFHFRTKDIENIPPQLFESAKGDMVIESAPWGWIISIPYEMLEAIVAKKVRNARISHLEEAEPEVILGVNP